jgi:hypothetical protein
MTTEVGRGRSPGEPFAFRDVVAGAGPWTGRPRGNAQDAHLGAVAIGPGSEGAGGVLIAKPAPAGLTKPFTMPFRHSESRGSTFLLDSIRIGVAGVMVG